MQFLYKFNVTTLTPNQLLYSPPFNLFELSKAFKKHVLDWSIRRYYLLYDWSFFFFSVFSNIRCGEKYRTCYNNCVLSLPYTDEKNIFLIKILL